MTIKKREFKQGIRLRPDTDALGTNEGELKVDSADNKIKARLDSANRSIVTEDQTQTLTNKIINADLNTITNLIHGAEVDNPTVAHGTTGDIVGDSDTQTLSNKTMDGDDNTFSDIGITSLKTELADASKFIERNGSGAVISGKAVPSGDVVGNSDTQTLTNKVINVDSNTLSNIETDNFKAGAIDTDLTTVSGSDNTLASAKAIKTYVDDSVATKDEASEISYDNTTSGLTATNVQTAVDEIEGRIDTIEGSSSVDSFNSRTGAVIPAASDYDADQVDYDNTISGLTAINVKTAIDEVDSNSDTINTTLSGHLDGSTNKHDATEVDYERSDGSKKNIQASSDDLEASTTDLDDAIGALDATPTNYTPTDPAIVADHLSGIDTALAGVSATDLDALTDVTLTAPSNGEVMKYNGSQWVNTTDNDTDSISALTDTTISSPTNGQVLKHNGSIWVNAADDDTKTLADQTDVTITSPANRQVLLYNGTNWINDTLGPQLIKYGSTAGQTLTNNAVETIDFNSSVITKLGGLMTVTTGASWNAEALVDMDILVTLRLEVVTANFDDAEQIVVFYEIDTGGGYVSGDSFDKVKRDSSGTTSAVWTFNGSTTISLSDGDKIRFAIFHNLGSDHVLGTSASANYLNIIRLGAS
jgi:hypothetical protein